MPFEVMACCGQCLIVLEISELTERTFKVIKCCENASTFQGLQCGPKEHSK